MFLYFQFWGPVHKTVQAKRGGQLQAGEILMQCLNNRGL
jgi:hypothetical protein